MYAHIFEYIFYFSLAPRPPTTFSFKNIIYTSRYALNLCTMLMVSNKTFTVLHKNLTKGCSTYREMLS